MKLLQPDPKIIKLADDWKYVHSSKTNVSRTFKKERDRLAKLIQEQKKPNKVRELRVK